MKSNAYNMDFEENANKCVIFFLALQGPPTNREKARAQLGWNTVGKKRGFSNSLQVVGFVHPVGREEH